MLHFLLMATKMLVYPNTINLQFSFSLFLYRVFYILLDFSLICAEKSFLVRVRLLQMIRFTLK